MIIVLFVLVNAIIDCSFSPTALAFSPTVLAFSISNGHQHQSKSSTSPSWLISGNSAICQNRRALVPLLQSRSSAEENLIQEAERLLQRAQELRDSISEQSKYEDDKTIKESSSTTSTKNETGTTRTAKTNIVMNNSPWTVPQSDENSASSSGVGYRLYIDIGREEGTWMDRRWGASGKRIDLTLDVRFVTDGENSIADRSIQEKMVQDNFAASKRSSVVRVLQTASFARLRGGFERMQCFDGGYRIDYGSKDQQTCRFFFNVDGTPEGSSSTFGDIFIPKGPLYFSLPCFGRGITMLSSKEGIVSVREIGWNTGWRREESRIVGVFRAVPIETARKRDGF